MHSEGGQRSPVAPARLSVHLEVPASRPDGGPVHFCETQDCDWTEAFTVQSRGRDGSVGSPCLVSGVRDGRRAQVQRAAENLVKIVSKC